MTKRKRPRESGDKTEDDAPPATGMASASAQEKFRAIARRLARVSREELAEQQRRYEADRARGKKPPDD
jgi:hypothetical protein